MSEYPYQDPNHAGNNARHLSGKVCIEQGCGKAAGTAWSPFWCFACNVKRMDRISASMESMLKEYGVGAAAQSQEGGK